MFVASTRVMYSRTVTAKTARLRHGTANRVTCGERVDMTN